MADTQSSTITILLNGKEINLNIDEKIKEKIVELVKEEYGKRDLRINNERFLVSDYYEISIREIE
jgi:hypothetical protein